MIRLLNPNRGPGNSLETLPSAHSCGVEGQSAVFERAALLIVNKQSTSRFERKRTPPEVYKNNNNCDECNEFVQTSVIAQHAQRHDAAPSILEMHSKPLQSFAHNRSTLATELRVLACPSFSLSCTRFVPTIVEIVLLSRTLAWRLLVGHLTSAAAALFITVSFCRRARVRRRIYSPFRTSAIRKRPKNYPCRCSCNVRRDIRPFPRVKVLDGSEQVKQLAFRH
jgi:hypothetical protein